MQFDQVSNDRKPETETAEFAICAAIFLPETIEDVWQEVVLDAFSAVGDLNPRSFSFCSLTVMTTSPPRSVNLSAFETGFQMIW